jgi:hypothetical protein
MRIHVIAVGAMREPHFRDAAAEYLKRLKPYADVRVTEVADRDLSRDAARAVAERRAGASCGLYPPKRGWWRWIPPEGSAHRRSSRGGSATG